MIENMEAYNVYQELINTYPTVNMDKGCGAKINKPFVNAALMLGQMAPTNPFEEDTPAYNHFNDLLYFVGNVTGNPDCPFKVRCATAAIKMLHDNNMLNPFGEPVEDKEEVFEAETVELDPPQEVHGVVPEVKRWGRRKG